jgi:hypothetical protein
MKHLMLAVALVALASPAVAGPAGDKAQARISAIASGKVADITAHYTDKSTLHWVGGPLDGTYIGPAQLADVWSKFAKAQGLLDATVAHVLESSNANGSTVVSSIVFTGKNTIKVRYVQMYRNDRLVDEIWQVDPNLSY